VIAPFRLEALTADHDRGGFNCGGERLDRYFREQATQDTRRRVANCFVAIEAAGGSVAAYCTIASAGIPTPDLPAEITKRLPRSPTLPAIRIGRLAVDLRFRGRGLAAALLADAARRSLRAAPASFTLLVDAMSDPAAAFYEHYGFRRLSSQPRTLFLPLATAEKVLLARGD
jgi:ribosomal protein S18 acetylase RimI-like enzyme